MEAEGFYAPRQQLNFEESFCNGSDEIRDSRLARVESIKETWIGHGTYQSSVLNEMRIRSEDWLSKHPGVLSMFPDAVTPGKQRYVDLFLSNRSEFDRLRHPFLERERAFRQEEIRQFCTDLSRSSLFSLSEKLDRVMFYQAVLAEECPTAAYFYDKKRSRKGFPVFSKQVTEFLSLCLLVDKNGLCRDIQTSQSFEMQLSFAVLRINLGLFRNDTKKISVNASETIQINIGHFVPVGDSFRDYSSFEELERSIRGLFQAFKLIQHDIEGVVQKIENVACC